MILNSFKSLSKKTVPAPKPFPNGQQNFKPPVNTARIKPGSFKPAEYKPQIIKWGWGRGI